MEAFSYNPSMKKSKLLIIGYGNPLREDDGIGWHLAGWLRETLSDPDIEIIQSHQLFPEYADNLSKVDKALFIDCKHGSNIGQTESRYIDSSSIQSGKATFHHMNIEGILSMAQSLFQHTPKACIFSIESDRFAHSDTFSSSMQKQLESIQKTLIQTIEALII